ncbi:MAG: hypothetical protein Kow00123_18960 [Anaerolineales bacterium]
MLRSICRVLLILALLGPAVAAREAAAQTNTRVVLSPASALVGEGQTAAVEVRVENVQALYGLDIRISFDPAVVEVVDADATQAGVQVRPGDLLSVDFMIRNTADNAQGTIWYALTQLNPSEPVSGSGTAFIILFKGKQRGATSALTITYQKMATRAGEAIPASVVNGEIRVVEPAQSPPTPTPAPPPPQPTVPMPTPEPTQALPTVQPTATQPMPPATVAPTSTTLPAGTAPAPATATPTQPPAPTQAASQVAPTAAPTATVYTGPTAPPPTATPASAASGGSLDWALVLAGMAGAVVLFGVGWIVWRRTRGAGA